MDIIRFHKIDEENGYMSNWYMRDFVIEGKTYKCAEQYMMEQKALLFGDTEIAEKIMQTADQQAMQDYGRSVTGFDSHIWDGMKQLIVYKAVYEKFKQNPDIAKMLIATGDLLPVECAYHDHIWGIGMDMNDINASDPNKWNGQNLLGFTLKAVREEIKSIC